MYFRIFSFIEIVSISIHFDAKTTTVVQSNLLMRNWSVVSDQSFTMASEHSVYISRNECDISHERKSVQNGRLLHELWINYGIWIRCTIDTMLDTRDGGRKRNYSNVLREISARKIWQLIKLMAVSLSSVLPQLWGRLACPLPDAAKLKIALR